jgi:hypothetical protein
MVVDELVYTKGACQKNDEKEPAYPPPIPHLPPPHLPPPPPPTEDTL